MAYDLMLLADPGTPREEVLQILRLAPGVKPDTDLDNRFWLRANHGEAQINIGTKDPVESIHVELELGNLPLMEEVAERSLTLAATLKMYVEDVQWGYELTEQNLPEARRFWRELSERKSPAVAAAPARRPWWRLR